MMAFEVVWVMSVDEWKKHMEAGKRTGLLIMVDFTALWCPPARLIAPVLVDLAKKYPSVIFLKVDVDELKTIATENKVEAYSTFIFLKNGQEIERTSFIPEQCSD